MKNIKLYDIVIVPSIYTNEQFEVVGIRENEVELEGDWSGGTHNVCQRGWIGTNRVLFKRRGIKKSNTYLN
jgi:hypothetical protein